MLSGKTVLKGKWQFANPERFPQKLTTPSKSLLYKNSDEIKYSDGCGLLAGLTEFGGN